MLLGVVGVIYESCLNVIVDVGVLCFKVGNVVILCGGLESFYLLKVIYVCMVIGLIGVGLFVDVIQFVLMWDCQVVLEMLMVIDYIDVIVLWGGKGFVGLVQCEVWVLVFVYLEGIVYIYIDKVVDLVKVMSVVLNVKICWIGICGVVECLLIYKDVVNLFGQDLFDMFSDVGVCVYVGVGLNGVVEVMNEDWG